MKEELDKALVRDFPILYQDRFENCQQTCMCWGFENGDGWEPIIRKLSMKIENVNNSLPKDEMPCVAVQVKEKYGMLKVYVNYGRDDIYKWIDEAEEESLNTCEVCGNIGKLRIKDGYWYKTLCDECKVELKYNDIVK